MYADYVSAHARVLEGVRAARVRAITEASTSAAGYGEACVFHPEAAVVLWVHADTGNISPLCTDHLRRSLGRYGSEKDSYPPAIVPLVRRGAS